MSIDSSPSKKLNFLVNYHLVEENKCHLNYLKYNDQYFSGHIDEELDTFLQRVNFQEIYFPSTSNCYNSAQYEYIAICVFFCKDPNFDTPNRFCNHNCVVNEVTGVIFYVCMPLIYSMEHVMIFLF